MNLNSIAWPAERLGEAVAALSRAQGWTDPAWSKARQAAQRAAWTDCELSEAAARLGLETELVESDYAGLRSVLAACAPAILSLPDGRYFVVLARRGKSLRLLGPTLKCDSLPLDRVRAILCLLLEDNRTAEMDSLIASTGITGSRRAKVREALSEELLAGRRVRLGWLVRPDGMAPLRWQTRDFRVRNLLVLLPAAHALAFLCWLGAWWLLGQGVFSGHLDTGWLQAWALLLLTLVPLRLLASGAGGLFSIRAGALLKRRLLAGALRLEAEEIRQFGLGRLLGSIMEAETLEQMAVTGGFLGLTGCVELVLAGGILSLSPGPGPLFLLLILTLSGLVFVARYLKRQQAWTEARIALTDGVVDGMVGHRTRAVQQVRERWNENEDPAVARYYQASRDRDKAALLLRVVLPRGGFCLGIVALVPAFVATNATGVSMAVSLGAVMAAFFALRHLGEGLEQLLGSWVAFQQIRLFWRAVNRPEAHGQGQILGDATNPRPLLVDARNLFYCYPGRPEPVLQGASLRVSANERVLLEGSSGSGKSTLAAILSGQRQPQAGLCLNAGLDFASLGGRAWRRRIVLVPQFHENHILMGTLAFNLLLGRGWPPQQADLAQAHSLCLALGLGPLLERMPGGLFQQVGETGWQLSHGERERIFIARAVLQDAELIILDESVSSLDPITLRDTLGLLWELAPALLLIVHR